jgi:hypothetical protein
MSAAANHIVQTLSNEIATREDRRERFSAIFGPELTNRVLEHGRTLAEGPAIVSRARFDGLSAAQKRAFLAQGGTVTDDETEEDFRTAAGLMETSEEIVQQMARSLSTGEEAREAFRSTFGEPRFAEVFSEHEAIAGTALTMTRETFEAMGPGAQMNYVRHGGIVTD